MTEILKNGEELRTIRAKINVALAPFQSRAQFEAASIPPDLPMLYASDGAIFYRLLRKPGGEWVSADGAQWEAAPAGGLSPEDLQAAVDTAAETISVNGGFF